MGIMDVLDSLSGPEYDEPETKEEPKQPEEQELPEEPELPEPPQLPAEEPLPEKKPFRIRAEWVMAIVAAFAAVLVGVLLLAMFHAMTENYLIAILGRLGGDSSHVGVALFIATVVEAPVLFFFSRIRTRINDHWLLRYAAFSFLLKAVLFLLAPPSKCGT